MAEYREIAIEAPESALEAPLPFPEGMLAWKNPGNGFTVIACHYTADPEKRNDAWYTSACRNLRPDQVERELEINFESKAGSKAFPYLEYHPHIFRLDPPNPIPAHWKIIIGLDYGARNPTSITFYAIDEFKRFWAFTEYYLPSNVYKIAEYLKGHAYWPRAQYVVADPNIFNKNQNQLVTKETGQRSYGTLMSIAELLQKEGIYKIQRANNDRLAGIARVHHMFNFRGDPKLAKPYLFIGSKCNKQWWEMCNLVHKLDDNEGKNADEDVVKRNDHAFDELKYALLSQDVPAILPHDPRAGFATLKSIEDEIEARYDKEENDNVFHCSFHELDGDDEFAEVGY